GRGEIVGEVSLADGRPSTATVTALSETLVFEVPRAVLLGKLERDTGFAARFYKALTVFLSDRLRVRGAARRGAGNDADPGDTPGASLSAASIDNLHLAQARLERMFNRLAHEQTVLVTGNDLTIDDVVRVARDSVPVAVAPLAMERVVLARQVVDAFAARPEPVYGLTTGLGALADTRITAEQNHQFQENILKSHAAGIEPDYSPEIVRAILLARINGMARGGSGVQPGIFSLLVAMLNAGITPVVPSRGSIGMSDLVPLAHLALPLIGLGEVDYGGRRMASAEAFALAGLEPVPLGPKDGLSLVSSNAASIGHGALVLFDSLEILKYADIAAALSLEAIRGNVSPLDERTHAVRPYSGQLISAERMRSVLGGSHLWRPGAARSLQDPLSFRCSTQVHGACHDALAFARRSMEIELNSTGDNPVVLSDDQTIVSNGNFHPAGLAMSFDTLAIVLAQLSSLASSRVIKLNDPTLSGLPPQLTPKPGLNCGFGVIQKTVTALNAESRFLASPASLDFMAVAGAIEDHATNTTISVRKASQMVGNLRYTLAIELLTAAQAITLLGDSGLGRGTAAAYGAVRAVAPFIEDDTVLSPAIKAVHDALESGELWRAVSAALEPAA
ncbi:MAG TPA: aromatic amino acid lyase, partial [Herpetosiphonaceae bacterium]